MGAPKGNPQVKAQSAAFLRRAFAKTTATTMPKKTLKTLMPLLVKVRRERVDWSEGVLCR